ncbi:spore-associated protein A [Streptomyces sp. NPDC058299]|uniref:spore-associated protein A n=1 Tax=Streptomyces sp. NPDC058299 TaxID=3346435 RepID=UPI0036E6EF2E
MSHMSRARRVLSAVAVAGTATAALLAAAPGASAVAQAAYNGACGSGYSVVNSAPVGNKGTAYLTYSSSTGKNCLVMIRNLSGDPVPMELYLNASGDEIHDNYDSGTYRSYAGPLYLSAKGRCVDWYGRLDGVWFGENGTNCG